MSEQEIRSIIRELEDRGWSLAAIGRELGVSRQSVSRTVRHPEQSRPIREAIAAKLGRDPWRGTAFKKPRPARAARLPGGEAPMSDPHFETRVLDTLERIEARLRRIEGGPPKPEPIRPPDRKAEAAYLRAYLEKHPEYR